MGIVILVRDDLSSLVVIFIVVSAVTEVLQSVGAEFVVTSVTDGRDTVRGGNSGVVVGKGISVVVINIDDVLVTLVSDAAVVVLFSVTFGMHGGFGICVVVVVPSVMFVFSDGDVIDDAVVIAVVLVTVLNFVLFSVCKVVVPSVEFSDGIVIDDNVLVVLIAFAGTVVFSLFTFLY